MAPVVRQPDLGCKDCGVIFILLQYVISISLNLRGFEDKAKTLSRSAGVAEKIVSLVAAYLFGNGRLATSEKTKRTTIRQKAVAEAATVFFKCSPEPN